MRNQVKNRRYANTEDTNHACHICDRMFVKGKAVVITHNGRPVHRYKCARVYYASIVVYHDMRTVDLVLAGFNTRDAYRIMAKAKDIRNGNLHQ